LSANAELHRQLAHGLWVLDEAEIIAAALQLRKVSDPAQELPLLIEVLNHSQRFRSGRELGRLVVPTVIETLGAVPRSACLRLVDAGRWVEWAGWPEASSLSGDATELSALLRHPQPEVALRSARDFARLDSKSASEELQRMFASEQEAERSMGAIAAARVFQDDAALSRGIAAQLQSSDANVRFWAIWSLAERLPHTIEWVLEALSHSDARVREEAISALEIGLDASRFVAPLPELETGGSYSREPGGDWREKKLFNALSQARAQRAIAPVVLDSNAAVQQTACMLVAKLGFASDEIRAALLKSRDSTDPVAHFWAGVALERIENPRWPSFRLLLKSSAARSSAQTAYNADEIRVRMAAADTFRAELDDDGFHRLPNDGVDERFEAVLALARNEGTQLLASADRSPSSAAPTLDLAEAIVQSHLRTLLLVATENTFEAEDAVQLLVRIGPAAVELTAAAWLGSTSAFAGGHEQVVMDTLGEGLASMGNAAIPALSFGMERAHLGLRCADYLSRHGEAALLAAPAWIRAWRQPQGSDSWLGIGSGWEARDSRSGQDWTGLVCMRMDTRSQLLLARAIKSPLPIVRERACHGFRGLSQLDTSSVESLRAALDDTQPRVRIAAAQAIIRCAQADRDLQSRASNLLSQWGRL
jgi:hypothetical protein